MRKHFGCWVVHAHGDCRLLASVSLGRQLITEQTINYMEMCMNSFHGIYSFNTSLYIELLGHQVLHHGLWHLCITQTCATRADSTKCFFKSFCSSVHSNLQDTPLFSGLTQENIPCELQHHIDNMLHQEESLRQDNYQCHKTIFLTELLLLLLLSLRQLFSRCFSCRPCNFFILFIIYIGICEHPWHSWCHGSGRTRIDSSSSYPRRPLWWWSCYNIIWLHCTSLFGWEEFLFCEIKIICLSDWKGERKKNYSKGL